MKVKQLLIGFFVVCVFAADCVQAQARRRGLDLIQGTIQVEILEGTEDSPTESRYFIQRCGGRSCNIDQLRSKVEAGQLVESEIEIRHVYLRSAGKHDFSKLVQKDVILRGNLSKSSDAEESLQDFNVSEVLSASESSNAYTPNVAPMSLPPSTVGLGKTLVILAGFQSMPGAGYTREQVMDWVFAGPRSAREYFLANSFGSYSLGGIINPIGDVTPRLELTANPTVDCMQNMQNSWRIEADNLAEQQGYSKVAYRNRIIVFPRIPTCPLMASAQGGQFGNENIVRYAFLQLPSSGTTEDLYRFMSNSLYHEIFHLLGQGPHSSGQQCETCPIEQGNDEGDIMGTDKIVFLHNVHRLKLGWTSISKFYPALQTRGSYLVNLQTPAVRTKGIGPNSPPVGAFVVLRDNAGNPTGDVLVFERRRSTGIWEVFTGVSLDYSRGIALRKVSANLTDPQSFTTIIDTTSSTSCCRDAPLVPGVGGTSVWSSSTYGIEVVAYTPAVTGALIRVTLGPNYPTTLPGS